MKKFFSTLLILFVGLLLVGCTKPEEKPKEPEVPKGPPQEITIMYGAPREIDPFDPEYTGDRASEKRAKLTATEEKLNVKIKFIAYPEDANWGPIRQNAIIDWHLAGEAKADIYGITSDWLPSIAAENAIASIDPWLKSHGKNIHEGFIDLGSYQGKSYGYNPGVLTGNGGLFYNNALVRSLGLEDPAELWNKGEWTWDKFKSWGIEAKTALGSGDKVPFSGMPSYYAIGLIAQLGGSIVNPTNGKVEFTNTNANQAYEYIDDLYKEGLFDTDPKWDGASQKFIDGNAIFHWGEDWFVNHEVRWGQLDFTNDISAVPYPLPAGKTKDDYVSFVSSHPLYVTAANPTNPEKEELAFQVWNELQVWLDRSVIEEDYTEYMEAFLSTPASVKAMMDTFGKVKFDAFLILGIPDWNASSYQSALNNGFREGDYATRLAEIVDSYQAAADKIFK